MFVIHMLRRLNHLAVAVTVLLITYNAGLSGKTAGRNAAKSVETARLSKKRLWQSPGNISSRDLFYGLGGESHRPSESLTFLREDTGGSNPKFDVKDESGVRWKVKIGEEAQPEVVASRFLWAVGYYTDEDYFLPSAKIKNLPTHLSRGDQFVRAGGVLRNIRLERHDKTRQKEGSWSWRNAPMYGTREFNGLRVMMALINNWDLKDENNTTFENDHQTMDEVSDLGATFGTTGVGLIKSNAKGNLKSYEHSKFITKVRPEDVDFATPSLPSLPYIFNPFQYGRRARLRWIGRHVDRSDAKWIGSLLGQLSPAQLRDAFRAAGYSPAEITGFTKVVQKRIAELNAL